MHTLETLIETSFPFNRKERFFTGTVLPSIVCRNNFEHFTTFLQLLAPEIGIAAHWQKNRKNILFFTEYNYLEAKYGKQSRDSKDDLSGDTPDVVFFIDGKVKLLFALEAKMFHNTDEKPLYVQLEKQKRILIQMAAEAKVDVANVYHYALLPQKLLATYKRKPNCCVTWEAVLMAYLPLLGPNDYCIEVLRYALDNYEELKGTRRAYGKNSEGWMKGITILNRYAELNITRVGRQGGINGEQLRNDIQSGSWKKHPYEYSTDKRMPKSNWFSIDEFVTAINNYKDIEQKPKF